MSSKYQYMQHFVYKLKPGEAHVATQGAEFDCQPQSFQNVIYRLASEKGGGWRGTSTVIGDRVIYAFYKMSDYMRPNLPAYPIVKKLKGEL